MQIARRLRNVLARLYVRSQLPLPAGGRLVRVGSAYGGWVIPDGLLHPESLVYSGGLGEDISFEIGVLERYRCAVFGFDPTPRAKAYVEKIAAGKTGFHYLDYGLWSSDAPLRF